MVPMLPHLGTVETSGLGVLLMFGINRNLAVGSFLALRVLATGAIILFCALLLLLHRQTGVVLRQLADKCRGCKPPLPDPPEPPRGARAG